MYWHFELKIETQNPNSENVVACSSIFETLPTHTHTQLREGEW